MQVLKWVFLSVSKNGMFQINERFVINPATGSCEDLSTNRQIRLEPRIMQLLLMLVEQPFQVISRETLVTMIWNDYGGGDEGLTQGISVLRKALSDDSKELIQTLPKKGYCFTGRVTAVSQQITNDIPPKPVKKISRLLWLGAAVVLALVIIITLTLLHNNSGNSVKMPDDLAKHAATAENSTNTITTRDKNNITYKLVMIEDRPPVFYRGDSMIPVGQWEPYQDMINYLKAELARKNRH